MERMGCVAGNMQYPMNHTIKAIVIMVLILMIQWNTNNTLLVIPTEHIEQLRSKAFTEDFNHILFFLVTVVID